MSNTPSLLPCPFCGAPAHGYAIAPHSHSPAVLRLVPELPDHPGSYVIEGQCPCGSGLIGANESEVTARWNRRTPQQEAQEPRFNCWSTNEGDSWFDHPADSQAIYDCLGNDAKVGDEYELTAGWTSVTARYRITEVVGDGEEYEVECVSHPHENSAPPASTCPRRRLNLAPMTLKITVYSKSACPQCESAKSLLKARSLPYEEIKIDDEAERLAFYAKCGPAVRQMPQVFINDQRVGGLTGLQAALHQLGL